MSETDFIDLDNKFRFHPATTASRIDDHSYVRNRCKELAQEMAYSPSVPHCDELLLGIAKIEEAMFWFNAAVARHDSEGKRK